MPEQMNRLAQAAQNFVERRGFKRLASWIFRTRIRWYVWRGRVIGARPGLNEASTP
jgi:hypothetical protein